MSRESVEIVRRLYDAAARRDRETVLALYDPDVELDVSQVALGVLTGQGVFRGHEGLRSLFREWHEAWESMRYDFDELIDAGDHVIAVVTRHGRGRASGAEVDWPVALVWTVRGGRVVRVRWFPSLERAREAARLPG